MGDVTDPVFLISDIILAPHLSNADKRRIIRAAVNRLVVKGHLGREDRDRWIAMADRRLAAVELRWWEE